jgi:predicted RNA-binding protein YlxR (DUF448 family)
MRSARSEETEPAGPARPARTCVGCRGRAGKHELARFVRTDRDVLTLDERQVLPGRGAYLHRRASCWDAAVKRRAFARALRGSVVVASGPAVNPFA